ncbi:MAG: flagellar basal body P-ring formation chaperone FlgA [Gammaproteobacteria bacterium]|nr:flagellar basal body P-ring formation chaperone FlgA [Gammaproteobacteria bacterium]
MCQIFMAYQLHHYFVQNPFKQTGYESIHLFQQLRVNMFFIAHKQTVKILSFSKGKNTKLLIINAVFGLFLILLLFASQSVQAREIESIQHIRESVQNYMEQNFKQNPNIHYEIGYLDQRLKLDKCQTNLDISQSESVRQTGNTSLVVRCMAKKTWKIHVPVKIKHFAKVLVSKRTLARGHIVNNSDVEELRVDITRLNNGYFTSIDDVKGLALKRSLREGRILTNGMLEQQRLIKRGELVTILAKTGNLSIRMKGTALMDGRAGELIRVKNRNSKREIQAIVVSSGTVKVSM